MAMAFFGTNMNPGHLNLFVQMLMDSSKQFMNPWREDCISCLFAMHQSSVKHPKKGSAKAGGLLSVKAHAPRMRSTEEVHLLNACQWDELPKTGGTVDQSWLTSTAIGQAISRICHNEQGRAPVLPSQFLFVVEIIVFLNV